MKKFLAGFLMVFAVFTVVRAQTFPGAFPVAGGAAESAANATQVGTNIKSLLSEDGKLLYGNEPNSIVVIDYEDNLRRIEEFIGLVDVAPQQVLIEARVVEVKLDKENALGINWNALADKGGLSMGEFRAVTGETAAPGLLSQAIPTLPVHLDPSDASTTALSPFTLSVFNDSVHTIVKTLASVMNTDVLSAPRITTVNNSPAEISVVKQLWYVKVTANASTADASTLPASTDPISVDVGIRLKVMPTINPDGMITLYLNPSISEKVGDFNYKNGNNTYPIPIIDKRSAATKVVVGNAQTLVIGGLIKDATKTNHFKVPVLGDIPLLGHLFKTEYSLAQKTELLILVSATIVDSKEQARMKREYDRVGNRVQRIYDKGTSWERAKKRAVDSAIADPRIREMAELSRQIDELAQERKAMETNIARQEQEVRELRKQKQELEAVKKKVK